LRFPETRQLAAEKLRRSQVCEIVPQDLRLHDAGLFFRNFEYNMAAGKGQIRESMLTSYNGKDLTGIVGAVYDCIADEMLWEPTLDRIRLVCDGYLATLGVLDTESYATRFSVASGDKDVFAPIASIHASNYSFLPAVPKMDLDQPYMMSTIYSVQGPDARDQWLESKLHREWALPNKIDDCIWVPMVKTPWRIGHLVVITHTDRGPITELDLQVMGQLAPHVRRAVTIGDLFEAERGKGEFFRDVIDALHTPVLFVSADMHILYANPSAELMLDEKIVMSSRTGRLEFGFRFAGNAIEHAVTTSRRDEFVLGPSGINVPLLRTEAPAVAHVMPLVRRGSPHRMAQKAVAAIFIATAGQAPVPAMDAIAALFGLTPTEKNIAAQLAKGRKTSEIANANGVSENTVRTHVASLFDKTGTNDQRDLIILMKDLAPPVREV
jgi:DNA-binding CsgD family transcriptional regulator/PAS domain-containing protein